MRPAVVVMVRNAFRLHLDRDLIPVPGPVTIRGWLDSRGIVEFAQPTFCLVNGRAALRAEWPLLVIRAGDVVCFVALPHGGGGGGGGGKSPLRTVLMVALMVGGMVAGAAFGSALAGAMGFEAGATVFGSITWGQVFGGVISGAVSLVGGALVNAVIPPPKPAVPQMSWGGVGGSTPAPSPTYSLQAQGNQARLGNPIPVPYGRHRLYPDLGSNPWSEYADNEQYLYQLHVIGQGEYEIEAIRIEDTPIASFEEVSHEVIPPGGAVTLFAPNVVVAPEIAGQELPAPNELGEGDDGWIGPFIVNDPATATAEIGIDVVFARGLYYANDDGGLDARTITWTVEARAIDDDGDPVGAGAWSTLGSESVTDDTNTAIRRTYSYSVASGRYEVRAKRTDTKDLSSRAGHEARWAALKAFLAAPADYGDTTLLAIRIKATDQMSQRNSRLVNVIATRKLPTWNAQLGWSAPTPTRSIAWAIADVLRADYGAGLADARIDIAGLAALDAVWDSRGDHFDGVFDTGATIWEALTRIARCGRAVPIQQGGVVRIIRDAPQTLPVALFGPRNIVKGSLELEFIMPGDDTADAVTVEYYSAKTWKPAEITAKLADSPGDKPAKVQLFGCTDPDHAAREGHYIAADNRYRRRIVTFRTELAGMIPTYGDLIAINHDMPRWGLGGEVTAWTADGREDPEATPPWTNAVLTLSEPPAWSESATHYICLRARDGSVAGPFVVEPVASQAFQVAMADPLTITPYVGAEALRTLFSFGPGDAWARLARVIAVRPRGGVQVEIKAVVEDNRVHEEPA